MSSLSEMSNNVVLRKVQLSREISMERQVARNDLGPSPLKSILVMSKMNRS